MVFWIIIPFTLSAVSFLGSWTVYALALRNGHVCSLNNWEYRNSCQTNDSGCCTTFHVPTISWSGTNAPENSLFSATINAGAFLFLVFCIFHHAHILDRNSNQSLLAKISLVFGCVASCGAFVAGNCNPAQLSMLHYLGAAVSFVCLCFYCVLLTSLTNRCLLTGLERYLYPARIVSTVIQVTVTILYCIFFAQEDYFYKHISAIFEWTLSVNIEAFELSFVVEFYFFSSSMLTTLLERRGEEKPLILA
ncbi:transmembrane protein 150A [Clupea harengus]|uniref:Transmembrane protein 150A n=1 Tax=Clupea harengus TaxID=7950 RepID=A0A6P8GCZ3_CLUHA|nr:transmembrane protein 150A [Clupea harengus]XP_031434776.1 transmembrane protein 150A [Clupea harengus]XP_042565487.1 transmembrane protein 150A [Clupea harengus]XP_042565488.1 transmembrane protein 150A [Clupea harengus]